MSKRRTRHHDGSDEQDGSYEIGYGKPPVSTRFPPGQSGNPRGRPRGATRGRAHRLAHEELYRLITVKEGDKTTQMPALQVVLRAKIGLAAKGNGPAQRGIWQMVQELEDVIALENTPEPAPREPEMTDLERARRIAFALEKGRRELDGK